MLRTLGCGGGAARPTGGTLADERSSKHLARERMCDVGALASSAMRAHTLRGLLRVDCGTDRLDSSKRADSERIWVGGHAAAGSSPLAVRLGLLRTARRGLLRGCCRTTFCTCVAGSPGLAGVVDAMPNLFVRESTKDGREALPSFDK
eukprot:scaffold121584_cov42-Phaeocystis_antarctica.AAC.1